jgi:hypothetical protein
MIWKEFFPMYRQMQKDFPDVYIKNAATPPKSADGRNMVREIKVDVVVDGRSTVDSKERMREVLDELNKRVKAIGGNVTIIS